MTLVVPDGLDSACLSLFEAMSQLPGIETTESCCGHGKEPFLMWFRMDPGQIGADVLTRCLSGRYYCYFEGEQRQDPYWRVYIADSETGCSFVLEGKPMPEDGDRCEPAEKLAANLQEHIDEGFAKMWRCRED